MAKNETCPCGSGLSYLRCCGVFHHGARAPDAEKLMRSRYSAYVLGLENYLLATWHASTRPEKMEFDPTIKWLMLEVKKVSPQEVEFVARYRVRGKGERLHETSKFLCEDGAWYYLEGVFAD